jgi:hypothetical protein
MLSAKEMMDIVLAACVVELRADGTDGNLCATTKYPGEAAPLDYAECGGMLWVRLATTAPTTQFPNAESRPNVCASTLAFNLEVGLMRPSPIPEDTFGDFQLPSDQEHSESTDRQMDDMEAIYRGLVRASRDIEMVSIGSYTPVGPVGGTVGGTWTLVVGNE